MVSYHYDYVYGKNYYPSINFKIYQKGISWSLLFYLSIWLPLLNSLQSTIDTVYLMIIQFIGLFDALRLFFAIATKKSYVTMPTERDNFKDMEQVKKMTLFPYKLPSKEPSLEDYGYIFCNCFFQQFVCALHPGVDFSMISDYLSSKYPVQEYLRQKRILIIQSPITDCKAVIVVTPQNKFVLELLHFKEGWVLPKDNSWNNKLKELIATYTSVTIRHHTYKIHTVALLPYMAIHHTVSKTDPLAQIFLSLGDSIYSVSKSVVELTKRNGFVENMYQSDVSRGKMLEYFREQDLTVFNEENFHLNYTFPFVDDYKDFYAVTRKFVASKLTSLTPQYKSFVNELKTRGNLLLKDYDGTLESFIDVVTQLLMMNTLTHTFQAHTYDVSRYINDFYHFPFHYRALHADDFLNYKSKSRFFYESIVGYSFVRFLIPVLCVTQIKDSFFEEYVSDMKLLDYKIRLRNKDRYQELVCTLPSTVHAGIYQ